VESFSPPAKGGKVPAFILLIRRDCEKTADQEWPSNFISKSTKERTIQHLLNVFVLKNVLNFAMPAKPESGCQKTTLSGLFGVIRRRRYRSRIGSHQRKPARSAPARTFARSEFYVVRDCQNTPSANLVNGVFDILVKFSLRETLDSS